VDTDGHGVSIGKSRNCSYQTVCFVNLFLSVLQLDIGFNVVGWVGSWIKFFTTEWVGLGRSFGGLGRVEEIGPMDNSDSDLSSTADWGRRRPTRRNSIVSLRRRRRCDSDLMHDG